MDTDPKPDGQESHSCAATARVTLAVGTTGMCELHDAQLREMLTTVASAVVGSFMKTIGATARRIPIIELQKHGRIN